jgi:hypothetical protein
MPKKALIECVKMTKIALIEYYFFQSYTTVSNTDLYLSYFNLSYVFPVHNDSVQQGLTVMDSVNDQSRQIIWQWHDLFTICAPF